MLKAFICSRLGQALVDRLIARAKRTPYFHLFHDDGTPYMERYWLLRMGMPAGWRAIEKDAQTYEELAAYFRSRGDVDAARKAAADATDLRVLLVPTFGIRVHRITSSDEKVFHDHPWNYTSLILRGGYAEFTPDWTHGPTPAHVSLSEDFDGEVPCTYQFVNARYYTAGSLLRRKAGDWHYLVLQPGIEAWTLFVTGEKQQGWGFLVDGLVKVPWRVYLQRRRVRAARAAKVSEPA